MRELVGERRLLIGRNNVLAVSMRRAMWKRECVCAGASVVFFSQSYALFGVFFFSAERVLVPTVRFRKPKFQLPIGESSHSLSHQSI
jgi:hypothetical protein